MLSLVYIFDLLVLFVVVYYVAKVVYQVWFHPLSHIPGPWYTAVGDVWNEWQQMRLVYSRSIDKLHKKYGPVVRIAANKVAFVDEQGMKIVYGNTSKLPKDAYYRKFDTNGNVQILTIQDHAEWAMRRRVGAPHYTWTNLGIFEGEIEKYTQELLNGFIADAGKTAMDLMSVFRHLLVDVVFATAFDIDNKTVKKWASGQKDPLDQAVTDFPKRQLMFSLIPPALLHLVTLLPLKRFRTFVESDKILMKAAKRAYDRFANDAEALKADADAEGRKSLMYRLILSKMPDTGNPMAEHEIVSESEAHLIGGSETTATTASYIIWALSQHPEVLAKLRDEIDANVPERGVAAWRVLLDMPYFTAVINEGLRLYSIIPGPLPRVVPPTMQDLTIAGYQIPAGTTVSTQAWTLHRQEDVFPNADTFIPERWLDGKESEKMKTNFIAFGVGPRICMGQNLGQIMLRNLISIIVRNFDIVPAPETTVESMKCWESFALFPKGLQAKFNLVPRAL